MSLKKPKKASVARPMPRIKKETMMSRWQTWRDEFNAAQTHLRDQLRLSNASTMESVILAYGIRWREALAAGQLADTRQMPSLYTNSEWLGSKSNCSARSVREGIKLLIELGLLEKKFHGWQHDYELWIHQWIVTGTGEKPPVWDRSQVALNGSLLQDQGGSDGDFSNISPPTTSRTIKNNINRDVDMWNVSPLPSPTGQHPMAQEPQEQHKNMKGQEQGEQAQKRVPEAPADVTMTPSKDILEQVHEHKTGGAARPENATEAPPKDKGSRKPERTQAIQSAKQLAPANRKAARSGPVSQDLLKLVILFWEYVKLALYQDHKFSDVEDRFYKNYLYFQVFNAFRADLTYPEWYQFYHQLLQRVDIAKRYVERDPTNRYIPQPRRYFDRDKPGGFKETDAWLAKQKLLQIHFKAMLEVQKAKQALQKGDALGAGASYRQGTAKARSNPSRFPAGTKPQKPMTRLELYQYWKHRIEKLGSQQATEAYLNYCTILNNPGGASRK